MALKSSSLQPRIILLVVLCMLSMVAVLWVLGSLSIKESIDRSLKERLVLAQTAADNLDYIMRQNLVRLQDVAFGEGVNLADKDLAPEKTALHNAYIHSIFTDGVFLLDRQGQVLWTVPHHPEKVGTRLSGYPVVKGALASGRPAVSDVITVGPSGKKVVLAVVSIKDRQGTVVGLVGGEIDPTGTGLKDVIQAIRLGTTGYIEIVDSQGFVLGSTRPQNLFVQSDHGSFLANLIKGKKTTVGTCHRCHEEAKIGERETEVMAFAPLQTVPWGISIRQSEAEALAPARQMKARFLTFSLFLLLVAGFLSWGMARSLIKPINLLNKVAQKIASGNLSDPIPALGQDEIGRLGQSLDMMRDKLKASLERIEEWNRELERRVHERTLELQQKEIARGELLRKVITAQEEERKRIARELHDETSQALAALVLALETASLAKLPERVHNLKALAVKTLDGLHRIIFDLRPALLDDLGLQSAIRWYTEGHLEPLGFKIHFNVTGQERRLPSEMETTLFRVVQEAITNVAKHSEGENVTINLQFGPRMVAVTIEDDGKGFDLEKVVGSSAIGLGLGVLGMKERVTLLDGTFRIESRPGEGTRVYVEIPLPEEGITHV